MFKITILVERHESSPQKSSTIKTGSMQEKEILLEERLTHLEEKISKLSELMFAQTDLMIKTNIANIADQTEKTYKTDSPVFPEAIDATGDEVKSLNPEHKDVVDIISFKQKISDSVIDSKNLAKLTNTTPANILQGVKKGYLPHPRVDRSHAHGGKRYIWDKTEVENFIKRGVFSGPALKILNKI